MVKTMTEALKIPHFGYNDEVGCLLVPPCGVDVVVESARERERERKMEIEREGETERERNEKICISVQRGRVGADARRAEGLCEGEVRDFRCIDFHLAIFVLRISYLSFFPKAF